MPEPEAALVARAVSGFRQQFGRMPAAVGHAPGRVNLIGEHTDHNGGPCLPVALAQRTVAAVAARDDTTVRVHSASLADDWSGDLADLSGARGWAGYATGVLWALDHPRGCDLWLDSTVPLGAGLSSSAALECAVAVAVDALAGTRLDAGRRRALAAAGVRAESEVVGAPTGGMDQAVALRARAGHALLLDFGDDSSAHVPLPLEEHGLVLLVIDTGVQHRLADGAYARRREECERAAAELGVDRLGTAPTDAWQEIDDRLLLRRARHVLTECDRVRRAVAALQSAAWSDLGDLLVGSHVSLRDDFEVSCPELDTAVDSALSAGALGARMTGGGFGGSAVALVAVEHTESVRAAVDAAYDAQGWDRPTYLLCSRGGGPADVTRP